MSLVYDWDKLGGATAIRDANGWHITRVAEVTGVVPGYLGTMAQPYILDHPDTPKVGDPYPIIMFGIGTLPVANVNVAPLDNEAKLFRLTVLYELRPDGGTEPPQPGEPPRVEIGATLQSAQTGFEIELPVVATDPLIYKPIFVEYNAPIFTTPEGGGDPVRDGEEWTKPQAARVGFQVPMVTFRFNRRETDAPGWKAAKYVAKVNRNHLDDMHPPWLDSYGFPQLNKRMWLCTRITGVSVGTGTEFDVTYEFQLNIDWDPTSKAISDPYHVSGWDPVVAYVDGKGNIPLDIREAQNELASPENPAGGVNKAIKRVQVYPSIDFDDTELPLSLAP